MNPLALLGAIGIGLSFGLTGAGGSILTLPVRCLLAGTGVGVLTGFLGVGGGFLLMLALAKFARLPLRAATGTSLANSAETLH